MHLIITLEQADARRWLLQLADDLATAGHSISFRIRPSKGDNWAGFNTLIALEKRIFGAESTFYAPVTANQLPTKEPASDTPLVIELSGSVAADAADLTIFLNGKAGIHHAAAALVGDHVPFVELRNAAGETVVSGLPAIETPEVTTRALGQFFRRLATLLLMAADGKKRKPAHLLHLDKEPTSANPLQFFARSTIRKIARRLFSSRLKADHWRVGIRPVSGPLAFADDMLIDGFTWLPDDGARYYADPILWSEAGRDFLFVEEFPLSSMRGIISYTELGDLGRPLFTPRPIIERATHLSYPLIFQHDGSTYMIPENSAENHVPLYRAARFPDVWEHVGPLLPDIGLHDATLFEHAGSWWLMGNEARQGGSSWDCLMIFRSNSPLGPFEAHPANPVLVDARATRPAGPVMSLGGRLIRPVQSCLGGYGRFIRFFEIDALSFQNYDQHECGRLAAAMNGPISGVHTYSRNDRYEAIDALTPRLPRLEQNPLDLKML